MKEILLTILMGIIAGVIDILPMIKMKLDKYAILSAFAFYFVMPCIIYNLNILNNLWWIKGGLITFMLAFPIIILVAKSDKKGCIPIFIMSIILGSIIGIIGYLLNLM